MAVVTNCALLYIMSEKEDAADASSASWQRAWICVSMDHILLALQALLGVLIPAVPHSVRMAMAAAEAGADAPPRRR